MSTERLTSIPAGFTAGDSIAITLTLSDYPATTWALAWTLAGVDKQTATYAANGTAHNLDLTSAQTATLGAGLYQWSVRATSSTESFVVQSGTLTVTADLSTLAPGAAVSWEAQTLEVLRASIAGSLDVNMADFMIDGRRVVEIPLMERMKLLQVFEARVSVQRGEGFGAAVRWSYRGAVGSC